MIAGFDPAKQSTPLREVDAEYAELDDQGLETVVAGASELTRLLLANLAEHPNEPRRYVEIEDSLGWSRGRLASELGGYAAFLRGKAGGKRPYRIGQDEDGDYWMWADKSRADSIRASFNP